MLDGLREIAETGFAKSRRVVMTSLKTATVLAISDFRPRHRTVFFTRSELNQLLALYSRQVSRGVWRDYAIDHREGMALFSVFRHSRAAPIYRVAKIAGSAGQPPFFVVLGGRQRLRSSRSLADVLDYFRTRLTVIAAEPG